MAISGQSFTSLVSQMVTSAQAAATAAIDASVGSIPLALFQAVAAILLWLQGLVLQLLSVTRLSTSAGADVDTFIADFGMTRLPAITSSGSVTFGRFGTTIQAVVPIGAIVSVGVGGLQFGVTLDASNGTYSAALGGYVIAIGVTGVTVPVSAVAPGAASNAIAGSINSILQSIPNVDTVTNAAPMAGGFDPETDAAVMVRFALYIQSLSKATKYAVGYAVTSIRQGLVYLLVENKNIDGSANPGFFFVVVDDGTGSPPSYLINAAGTTIEAIRACGVTFAVFAPTIVPANISMVTTSAPGANHSADIAAVSAALTAAIDALPLGAGLSWSQLSQIAYNASPTVTNVVNVLLNGSTADLSVTPVQVLKVGTLGVS